MEFSNPDLGVGLSLNKHCGIIQCCSLLLPFPRWVSQNFTQGLHTLHVTESNLHGKLQKIELEILGHFEVALYWPMPMMPYLC
jgi:hypothetical protein